MQHVGDEVRRNHTKMDDSETVMREPHRSREVLGPAAPRTVSVAAVDTKEVDIIEDASRIAAVAST